MSLGLLFTLPFGQFLVFLLLDSPIIWLSLVEFVCSSLFWSNYLVVFHCHMTPLILHCGNIAGFIAMYATLASRDVDCCLIPESPFYLEGPGGLFEYIEKRLRENGHMVLVIAEGAGQDLLSESIQSMGKQDASGNKLLQDVGLWLSQKIKVWKLK